MRFEKKTKREGGNKNSNKGNAEVVILLFALSETRMFSYVENTESRKKTGRKGRGNRKWIRKENTWVSPGEENKAGSLEGTPEGKQEAIRKENRKENTGKH